MSRNDQALVILLCSEIDWGLLGSHGPEWNAAVDLKTIVAGGSFLTALLILGKFFLEGQSEQHIPWLPSAILPFLRHQISKNV